MRITSRTKAIAFFITLGACLLLCCLPEYYLDRVSLAASGAAVLGIIFFGYHRRLVVNTIFIVREIRRNERKTAPECCHHE